MPITARVPEPLFGKQERLRSVWGSALGVFCHRVLLAIWALTVLGGLMNCLWTPRSGAGWSFCQKLVPQPGCFRAGRGVARILWGWLDVVVTIIAKRMARVEGLQGAWLSSAGGFERRVASVSTSTLTRWEHGSYDRDRI